MRGDERRLEWGKLPVDVMSEDTDAQTNNQLKTTLQSAPTSLHNSDFTLRFHHLPTAEFTEKLKGPLRSLRQGSSLIPPSPICHRAGPLGSFTSLPHDPARGGRRS